MPLRNVMRAALLGGSMLACPSLALAQSAPAERSQPSYPSGAQSPSQPANAAGTANFSANADDVAAAARASTDTSGNAASTNPNTSDPNETGSILDEDLNRLNLRESMIDERPLTRASSRDEASGVRIGTFVLRPSVSQTVNTETNSTGTDKDHRTFLETGLHGTLTSDWSLHQLTVTADGIWQQNISGSGEEQPNFTIGSDLRLDLPSDTTAHITSGYQFYREDTDDPDAILDARQQSDVQHFSGGFSLERDFGVLRGSGGIELDRYVYSDAELSDGTQVSQSDRNETSGTLRGRIGYELSPALIPFVEALVGRGIYDDQYDSAGYDRSNQTYGGKAGVEVDLGEKLRGEMSVGYETEHFDDPRLASIDAPTVDANINWSPQRGTNVNIGVATSIEPSTTAGEGGYTARALSTTITHEMRDNLVASLTGSTIWRNYPSDSSTEDETVYLAGAGLAWNINRYLDLITNTGYELTSRDSGPDTHQWRAGVGLKLQR